MNMIEVSAFQSRIDRLFAGSKCNGMKNCSCKACSTGNVKAGGQGSGRHPQYGMFKRAKDSIGDKYSSHKGYSTEAWHHAGTRVTVTDLYNEKKDKDVTLVHENNKLVHRGYPSTASYFLKNRYGINDKG